MEIMFEDLTVDAQDKLLKAAGISRPEDMDWDELPVAVIDFNDPDDFDFGDDDDDMANIYDDEDDYYN